MKPASSTVVSLTMKLTAYSRPNRAIKMAPSTSSQQPAVRRHDAPASRAFV